MMISSILRQILQVKTRQKTSTDIEKCRNFHQRDRIDDRLDLIGVSNEIHVTEIYRSKQQARSKSGTYKALLNELSINFRRFTLQKIVQAFGVIETQVRAPMYPGRGVVQQRW